MGLEKQKSSRNGTTQALNIGSTATTATSVSAGSAFGSETWQVRLFADINCNYAIGDGTQTASSSNSAYLPANVVEYVTVTPGQNFAAVRTPADGLNTISTAGGTIWVTELS